jgi:Rps23 Pro-64 3,4-dihydroxylase Tpa1-like proline 4-hydroxylase
MTVDVSAAVKESNILDLTAFDQILDSLRQKSDSLRQSYAVAKPYPHVVIDDLFPAELLDRLIADFPQPDNRDWLTWDTSNELKSTSKGIQGLSTFTQMFCLWLNSVDVVQTIESIVGLESLVGDPLFHGAGLHEMHRDGWLDMHGDYTRHFSLPLMRRINILIYLNRDWDPSWGGELALQDATDESTRISYPCNFNRTIIFPTTAKTFHGAPTRLSCPPDRSRKLLSIYYWNPIPMPLWSKMGTPLVWAADNKKKLKKILNKA